MTKKIIISSIVIIIFFLIGISNIYSTQCSRNTSCSCGDTLTQSKEFSIIDNLESCTTSYALKIEADDVMLSCYGSNITNGKKNKISTGIVVNGDNVTIQRCSISGFYNGVEINNSTKGVLKNTSITNNYASGVHIEKSNNYKIYNNSFHSNSWDGIFLINSSNNTIYKNTITNNSIDGIQIYNGSYNNNIHNNNLINNHGHAIAPLVCGNAVRDLSNIGGNGKPIKYVEHDKNIEIINTNKFSEIILCNVSDSIITNVEINNKKSKNDGILLVSSSNNIIKNSHFESLRAGVYLYDSFSNSIKNNYFSNNEFGLRFIESKNNSVNRNTFDKNQIYLSFRDSNFNSLNDNFINNSKASVTYTDDSKLYWINNTIIASENMKISYEESNYYLYYAIVFIMLSFFIVIFFYLIRRKEN